MSGCWLAAVLLTSVNLRLPLHALHFSVDALYRFEMPFVIDDSETRSVLELQPTDWLSVVADVAGNPRLSATLRFRRRPGTQR